MGLHRLPRAPIDGGLATNDQTLRLYHNSLIQTINISKTVTLQRALIADDARGAHARAHLHDPSPIHKDWTKVADKLQVNSLSTETLGSLTKHDPPITTPPPTDSMVKPSTSPLARLGSGVTNTLPERYHSSQTAHTCRLRLSHPHHGPISSKRTYGRLTGCK